MRRDFKLLINVNVILLNECANTFERTASLILEDHTILDKNQCGVSGESVGLFNVFTFISIYHSKVSNANHSIGKILEFSFEFLAILTLSCIEENEPWFSRVNIIS